MTAELYYLTLSAILCLFLWLPYIGTSILKHGLYSAAEYREPPQRELPTWVDRAYRAHMNMVENLAPFAALVVVAYLTQSANETTATAAMVFFWARVALAIVHIAGIPHLRTLVFAVSWAAQLVIAWQILT